MMKFLLGVLVTLAAVGGGYFWLNNYIYTEKQAYSNADYKSLEFVIDGKPVRLANGVAETETVPGSATKAITRYFGNDAKGDLNGDGIPDLAFLLTHTPGGTGTFYYLVGAIQNADNTYRGTAGTLIGDRISPQTTEFRDGLVVVNYAERPDGEPMTSTTTVAKSLYLKYDPVAMTFGEVVQNFEGESASIGITYKPEDLLLGTDGNDSIGTYLIGFNGMPVYTFDNDRAATSNCINTCAETWPPYLIADLAGLKALKAGVKGTVGTITRADGGVQVIYNGKPLYFYREDTQGTMRGDGVNDVWRVAKP